MAKVGGTDIYLEVNTGTEASPVWTKIGGQRGATFDRGRDTIETTDKDSQNWEESLPGKRTWSIDFDAFLIEDDAGFLEIENSYNNVGEAAIKQFRISTPTRTYIGKAYVESLSIDAPSDDAVVASFTLHGVGSLTKT
jgi:TP901-1 family phage major tail protein